MRYNCGNYNALGLNKWHSEKNLILNNIPKEMITLCMKLPCWSIV